MKERLQPVLQREMVEQRELRRGQHRAGLVIQRAGTAAADADAAGRFQAAAGDHRHGGVVNPAQRFLGCGKTVGAAGGYVDQLPLQVGQHHRNVFAVEVDADGIAVGRADIQKDRLAAGRRVENADLLHQPFLDKIIDNHGDSRFGQADRLGYVDAGNRALPYAAQHHRTVGIADCGHIGGVSFFHNTGSFPLIPACGTSRFRNKNLSLFFHKTQHLSTER